MKYAVHHKDAGLTSIEADVFEADGSGTRFYNVQGEERTLVASFYAGQLNYVLPWTQAFEPGGVDEIQPLPAVEENPQPQGEE